ncbi:MAG: hypothetical protein K2R93_12340 [Gemmatimonadaceae bacterium]|nr:hypothetical protein [Gemmatimonadaceae bacterium]
MALALVLEDGSGRADANTFLLYADATAILEASPFASAWTSVTQGIAEQCLAEATAWLSRAPWDGVATTTTQALAFPRAWLETRDGYAVASNLIPLWLKQATARLAFWLSQQSATPWSKTGLEPGTELQLPGGLKLTPASGAVMPPDVRALICPFLRPGTMVVRA